MIRPWIAAVLVAGALGAQTDDPILRSMKDEVERARNLSIASLDNPYYVECVLEDVQGLTVSAALGALLGENETRFRVPRTRVRVGDYKFDNGNYVLSDFSTGSRYDPEQFPLDDDYGALRRGWWLATDRAFKTAVEAIARKRAALKSITQRETLPDYWKAEAVQRIQPVPAWNPASQRWPETVRSLSAIFQGYPDVLGSSVTYNVSRSVFYMYNSEGTAIRHPEVIAHFQVQAFAQAPDGATVRDSMSLPRRDETAVPAEKDLRAAVTEIANNVRDLVKAPAGESYTGPVLFEGVAGAQVMAELFAPNLALGRRPVGEPGRPLPFTPSELDGRLESRVLPEFLDVVDDPTQAAWKTERLVGTYSVDEEGVTPKPVTVVAKGRLKSFLLTRTPVRGFEASNGRARLPGAFGSRAASASNLFVRSSESMKAAELRKKLLELVEARNKPYGIIVRKMDFPSSAPVDEVRRMIASSGQSGSTRPVSSPVLVYRVYPDGREELVRGLRFRNFSVRSLRDILAVSDDSWALHYLNNMAPFALIGAGSFVAPVSVVAPSLLFEDLELERPHDDMPKLPIVPPPPLTSTPPVPEGRTSN